MAGQNALESLQEHAFFFIVDRAPTDQDRPGMGGLKAFAKMSNQRGRQARLQFELQVAGDFHAYFWNPQIDEARAVLISLREKQIHVADDLAEPPADPQITADGTIGNAGIDYGDRGAGTLR